MQRSSKWQRLGGWLYAACVVAAPFSFGISLALVLVVYLILLVDDA